MGDGAIITCWKENDKWTANIKFRGWSVDGVGDTVERAIGSIRTQASHGTLLKDREKAAEWQAILDATM